MAFTFRLSAPQVLQGGALLAALAGALVVGLLLITPVESHVPEAPPPVMALRVDTPAAQWFSNQPAVLDIKVSGVMAGLGGAVAILSLNDGPPRGFLAGERLAQGVRLLAIEPAAVVIERGSEQVRLKVNTLPGSVTLPRLTHP